MSRNSLYLIVLTVLIAGTVYWYESGSTNSLSISTASTTPAAKQFLDLAGELTPLSFDTDIFKDPRFTALVDLATPIQPEEVGRPDPFAPLPK